MKKCFLYLPIVLLSSSKNYDVPPLKPATAAPDINIAQIKSKFRNGQQLTFKNDSNLYCVITADETCGNLYHEIYVKDATGGLHIGLTSGGGLFTGDSIRINLKGGLLMDDNRLITIDSINPETHIVKLASGWKVQPLLRPLQELLANASPTNFVQSQLVAITDVAFVAADREQLFADALAKVSMTRTLSTCDGIELAVRTSGYSLLAGTRTPSGLGSITGILSQYGGSFQLILRSTADIQMNQPLCPEPRVYMVKDFNDNSLTSGGWSTQYVLATIPWTISNSGAPSPFMRISNFSSTTSPKNTACETWYISPVIDLSQGLQPVLTFKYAHDFTGKGLEIYCTTIDVSGKPQLHDWQRIDSISGVSGFIFATAGPYSLTNFQSKKFRLAFRYLGTTTDGATWEVDDIRIFEK